MRYKNLVKKASIITTLVALILCLYACSKNDKTNSVSSTTQSENETEMLFATRAEIGTSGTCGSKATWNYDADTKTLSILGSGEMSASYPGWSLFLSQIENITIGEEITSICDNAFTNCVNLKSIDIPEKVRKIGNNAFYGCKNLSFISIPYDINYIGSDAFFDTACYNDNKNWYNGILCINDCIIKVNENFAGDFTIWEYVTLVASEAFYQCENLTKITIPETVKYVNDRAFGSCQNLKSVSIENYVNLGECVFENCPNIEILDLNYTYYLEYFKDTKYYKNGYEELNGITYIGDYIINVNEKLSGICTIKEGVKSIDTNLFYETYITEIILPSSLKTLSENAYCDFDYYSFGSYLEKIIVKKDNPYFTSENGVLYDKNMTSMISYPESKNDSEFIVPDTVKRINHAFVYNDYLEKVHIGSGVEEISNGLSSTSYVNAFFGCHSLKKFEVSENNNNFSSDQYGVLYNKRKNVLRLYPSANKAEEFVIPSTVKTIEECAFHSALYLRRIYIPKNVEIINGGGDCFPYEERRDDVKRSFDIYYAGTEKEWEFMVGYAAENVHFNVKKFPEVTIPTTTKKASSTTPTTKKTNLFDWF